jgi:exodeoxyribonuclease V beta subunit
MLPFICSMREVKHDDSFVWHDTDGEPQMDLRADDAARAQADRERLQEDLRLLYVALTRARHACWLGIACYRVGNEKAPSLHKSAFGHVLSGGELIAPNDLMRRLDDLRGRHPDIAIHTLEQVADERVYKSETDQAAPLWDARTYTGRALERWWIASYSALKFADMDELPASAPETPIQDVLVEMVGEQPALPVATAQPAQGMHAFPAGAEAGTFLHGLFEWAADEGFDAVSGDARELEKEIARRCQRRGWQSHIGLLTQWLPSVLRLPLPLPDGAQSSLATAASYYAELEFWFEAQHVDTLALDRIVTAHTLDARPRIPLLADRINGLLKGFIDLVFEHQGRYYIVDYKSNKLGTDVDAYTPAAMRDSVLRERYDLQYAIYTLALHRQLRARLPDYDYERHVGGVVYLYLRGMDGAGHGVHQERLPLVLVQAMDRLFDKGAQAHAA